MKFFLQLRIKIIKSLLRSINFVAVAVVVRSILVVVAVSWSIIIAVVIITLVIFRLHEVSKIDHSGHGGGCQGGLDRERKGGKLGHVGLVPLHRTPVHRLT